MAIAFIYGTGLNMTLSNSSYFTITASQTYVQSGQPSVDNSSALISNCQPSWMGNMTSVYANLLCINTSDVKLKGTLYGSY
jgi:hypothetical protein